MKSKQANAAYYLANRDRILAQYRLNRDAILAERRKRRQQIKDAPPVDGYISRFFARVNVTPTCWNWMGTGTPSGYGTFSVNGCAFSPHRLAYLWLVGPITPRLTLHHLCRNRRCVNPDHLEPVTNREKTLRGIRARQLETVA